MRQYAKQEHEPMIKIAGFTPRHAADGTTKSQPLAICSDQSCCQYKARWLTAIDAGSADIYTARPLASG